MILDAEYLPNDIASESINVVLMDMPIGIEEQVTQNADGSYTVFLNSRYTYEHHVDCLLHALGHVQNRDFEKLDVQTVEAEAHRRG